MTQQKLMVKVSSIKDSLKRFKEVWEKAEHGEKIKGAPLQIISFENAKLLLKAPAQFLYGWRISRGNNE